MKHRSSIPDGPSGTAAAASAGRTGGRSGGQSREIVRLCAIPRGRDGSEELRFSVDEFTPDDDGEPRQYVSTRIWFRDRASGEFRPSPKGLTVRKGELSKVLEALQRAERILNGREAIREPTRRPSDADRTTDADSDMGVF